MAEWLVERGIGETRYALVEAGEILEARVEIEGVQRAGSIVVARLVRAAPRNAVARDGIGAEYLLPRGAPGVTEGGTLNIEVTREAIPGAEPWKRPLARLTMDSPREAPEIVARELALPTIRDELAEAGWEELLEQARSGIVPFDGGELSISPTRAMTLIDVDGSIEAEELAVRGAASAAAAIRRLDIGGSIGIDLPTTGIKAVRQKAADAIDAVLPQPFERTAVNGFGFVQLVRPRRRASLVELAHDRVAFEARALLRKLAFENAGAKTIFAHPGVIGILERRFDWTERLARQLGGAVGLRADATLPISGAYATRT